MKQLVLLPTKKMEDNRGYFSETYNKNQFLDKGIDAEFVQDNLSLSREIGTLRGLHFQSPPHAQTKLVRCSQGAIYDVAVDIRKGSPTFGKWEAHTLSAQNGFQFFIPVGFAHGFLTLETNTEVVYKCSDHYYPKLERSIKWDDPNLSISWPLSMKFVISARDEDAPSFISIDSPFIFGVNS